MTSRPVHTSTLTVGIDQVATGTQKTQGWSFFLMPTEAVHEFSQKSANILSAARLKLKAFHGKKFRKRDFDSYLEFLRLVRQVLEHHSPSLLLCSLMNEKWKGTFVPSAEKLLSEALKNASISDEATEAVLKTLIPPLFTFQRWTRELPQPASVAIEIGADDMKRGYSKSRVKVRGGEVHVGVPLRGFYNAYRKARFPNSPELEHSGVNVVEDDKSFLIQAADVFGNFALATLFTQLGRISDTQSKKAEILKTAFEDAIEEPDYASLCRIHGDNDLELLNDGTLNISITKEPEWFSPA